MGNKIEITVSHQFKASAERVYDAWLDPAKARIWQSNAFKKMGLSGEVVTVQINARVGGTFLFSDMRDGVEMKHWGEYLELDRPRKIVFTWTTSDSEAFDPTKVTLKIEPVDGGCVATITHEMDERWADYEQQAKDGWSILLTESAATAGQTNS